MKNLTKFTLAFLTALLISSPLQAQDAVDFNSCQIFASPDEVKGWPITKKIVEVELKGERTAASGVRLVLSPYNAGMNADSWPDFIMWPPAGDLRYTVWLFTFQGGVCRASGILEFWKDRVWTGAPLLTDYNSWVYKNPGSPWGAMGDYVPKVGDDIGFMVSSGDVRMNKNVFGTKNGALFKERSNIVKVKLVGDATFTFDGGQIPAPTPTPTPSPTPADLTPRVVALENSVKELLGALEEKDAAFRERFAQADDHFNRVEGVLSTIDIRLTGLEFRRIPLSCRASAFGIPISCRLE